MCVKLIYKDAVSELGRSAETCIYSHDATAQDGLKHHRMCGCVCVDVCDELHICRTGSVPGRSAIDVFCGKLTDACTADESFIFSKQDAVQKCARKRASTCEANVSKCSGD